MSIKSVMPSSHLIFCCPLLLLPSIFPSIRVFSNVSAHYFRWPKYWSFSFSISPSNQYSGFFSLRFDWFDLFAVQATLKSLLQHHSLKASILWYSAFFIIYLGWIYNFTELQIIITSHEIKRRLLLGRKVMTNLDSILKSRDITLSKKV